MADEHRRRTVAALVRLLVAVAALVFGVVWVIRLSTVGPALADGLLFELLGPALVIYLGWRYLRTQLQLLRGGSTAESD